ncbi:MAG: response regulator [Magnetococcales bacterium]|nr:response regulator [Magnetococcales bacterium]
MHAIKFKILVKFIMIIGVIVACSAVGVYWQQRTQNERQLRQVVNAVQNHFDALRQHETAIMQASISAIKRIETIRSAFLAQNRAELYALSRDLFEELRREFNITHFYYHLPDRVNLLRVHKPDRHGDRIDRATTRLALERGGTASGLELGQMGTLALRIVSPWFDGERLIGFLELGKEIDLMVRQVQQPFQVESFWFVPKKGLSRTDWQEGQRMLGQKMEWNAFADLVVIQNMNHTPPPDYLHRLARELGVEGKRFWHNVPMGEDHFNVGRIPIHDPLDQEVAFLLVTQDATAQVHQSQWIIALGVVVGIFGGVVLIVLFGGLLDRLERQLQKAEQRESLLGRIVEASWNPILLLDAATRQIGQVNHGAQRGLDYSENELLSMNILDLIPEAFREKFLQHFHALKSGFKTRVAIETELRKKDLSTFPVEMHLQLFDAERPPLVVVMVQDVTMQKQLLRSLQDTLTVTESANRMKSEFLANMSHEIRTPLNAIIGMTDLVLHTHLSREEEQHNLKIILQSSESLLELLNSILDVAKIDAGRLVLEHVPFDLSGQIENACAALALKAHQKEVELYCLIEPDVPPTVLGDPVRVKQVLTNLINNAIKFTGEGEVVLRIQLQECTRQPTEKAWLHFTVTDTGVGIPAEVQGAIFERFMQADGSTTRKFGGTGLGLNICKHLVSMMDGEMWLESEVGRGSVFHVLIHFDLAQRCGVGESGREVDERRPESPWFSLEGLRVLIADGHVTGGRIVDQILSVAGAVVDQVHEGSAVRARMEEAWRHDQPYDLMVLDFGLLQEAIADPARLEPYSGWQGKVVLLLPVNADQKGCANFPWLQGAGVVHKPVWKFRLLKAIKQLFFQEAGKVESVGVAVGNPVIPHRILVVEDHLQHQKVAASILESCGHLVTCATQGREALNRLRQGVYDLVLVDWNLSDMDGFTLARHIQEADPACFASIGVSIIAVIPRSGVPGEQNCLEAGAEGCYRKPYRAAELLALMGEMTRRRQMKKIVAVKKSTTPVLKEVQLEAALLARKRQEFLEQFPRHLEDLQRAILGRSLVQIGKAVQLLNDASREIGAWKVAVLGIRLRGSAEQNCWDELPDSLEKLTCQCQDVRQAILEKEQSP